MTFVLSDDPVHRTVERDGVLLDLDANDRVLALEVFELRHFRPEAITELSKEYDLKPLKRAMEKSLEAGRNKSDRRGPRPRIRSRVQRKRLEHLIEAFPQHRVPA